MREREREGGREGKALSHGSVHLRKRKRERKKEEERIRVGVEGSITFPFMQVRLTKQYTVPRCDAANSYVMRAGRRRGAGNEGHHSGTDVRCFVSQREKGEGRRGQERRREKNEERDEEASAA